MAHGNCGNQYRLALDCPEVRQDAYNDFCDHLAKGKAIKSWYYDKNGYKCVWATMLSYIDKNPNEFDPIQKLVAEAQGYQLWEGITEGSAKGDNTKANTASLQMVMRNKFGWDKKVEEDKKDSENITPEQITRAIRKVINAD